MSIFLGLRLFLLRSCHSSSEGSELLIKIKINKVLENWFCIRNHVACLPTNPEAIVGNIVKPQFDLTREFEEGDVVKVIPVDTFSAGIGIVTVDHDIYRLGKIHPIYVRYLEEQGCRDRVVKITEPWFGTEHFKRFP